MNLSSRLAFVGTARCQFLSRTFSTSFKAHAGHNKWSKIKEKKGATDAKKSVIYGKAHRDIVQAIRNGGSADPSLNHTLATALAKAKAAGVPKNNIENALTKASGKDGAGAGSVVSYEAMVGGKIGVIIECMTDNPTRTNHKIRELLSNHDSRYAPVGWLFENQGRVRVYLKHNASLDQRFDELWALASEAGADDYDIVEDDSEYENESDRVIYELYCPSSSVSSLAKVLESHSSVCDGVLSTDTIRRPSEKQEVSEEMRNLVSRLVDTLEDNEDFLRVFTTID